MYNKVITIGNLTRDIELKHLPSGTALAKSAIATSHKYKSQTGEQKEEVCFLDFTMFGRSAEIAQQYLKKGSKVMLEGRLVLERWVGQDGNNRSKHSLNVDNMKMLGGREENNSNTNIYHEENTQTARTPQVPDINKTPTTNIPEIDDPFDGEECPF